MTADTGHLLAVIRAVQAEFGRDAGVSLHVGQSGAWSCWSMRDATPGEPGSEIADRIGAGATLRASLADLLREPAAPKDSPTYYLVTRFGRVETVTHDGPRSRLLTTVQTDRPEVIAVTAEEDTARTLATLVRSTTPPVVTTTPEAPAIEPDVAPTVIPSATLAVFAETTRGRRIRIGEVARAKDDVLELRLDALPSHDARVTIREVRDGR